jgi:hypothetical protein
MVLGAIGSMGMGCVDCEMVSQIDKNRIVARQGRSRVCREATMEISQLQGGWNISIPPHVLEGRWKTRCFSGVLSGHGSTTPAILWLANILMSLRDRNGFRKAKWGSQFSTGKILVRGMNGRGINSIPLPFIPLPSIYVFFPLDMPHPPTGYEVTF